MTFAGLEPQDDVSGLLTGEENKDRLERKKECRFLSKKATLNLRINLGALQAPK